jgi:hypothetical protein
MQPRDIALLLAASWIGAAIIAFLVVELRDTNASLDDVQDSLAAVRDEVGLGDGIEVRFDPLTATSDDVALKIEASSNSNVAAPGLTEGAGYLLIRIENTGATDVAADEIPVSGTAADGQLCGVVAGYEGFAGRLPPGQHDTVKITWDCEDLQTLYVYDAAFQVLPDE